MENEVKLKKGVFGYNAKKVAGYIETLSGNFSKILDDKDKKISELESEIKNLKNELKVLKDEKESIANILISAKNEAKKITDEANIDANRIRLQADVELENTLQKISNAKEELVALKSKTLGFINDYKDLIDGLVKSGSKNED